MPRKKSQHDKYGEDIPNFDPNAATLVEDDESLEQWDPEPIWSEREQYWKDLKKTVELLLSIGAPVVSGFVDGSRLFVLNWETAGRSLSEWYKRNLRPDRQQIQKKAAQLKRSESEVESEWRKALENSLPKYRLRVEKEIREQFLSKMKEAISGFLYEVNNQVCRALKDKRLPSPAGIDFVHTYTEKDKNGFQSQKNRIEKLARCRTNAPKRGRQPGFDWTIQVRQRFTSQYLACWPEWKRAKRECKVFQKLDYAKRTQILKELFPNLQGVLLDHLSLRASIAHGQLLSSKDSERSSELDRRCSTPSEFALQHAAISVGIPAYQITSRQLKKRLLLPFLPKLRN